MYCTKCGEPMAETARFCTRCGAPAVPPVAAPAGRKLHRIVSEKKIAGVCAGFADYFNTDITTMRIIWLALLLLPPHIGLIAYIVSWAVLPKAWVH